MHERDHQHLIDELQILIDDTHATLNRAEAHGLDAVMPEDYAQLLTIWIERSSSSGGMRGRCWKSRALCQIRFRNK